MTYQWDDSKFKKSIITKAIDGLEEWAKVEWHPAAFKDSPVKTGVMRGSLGEERDDANKCIYVGGGGESSSYILKNELDRSIHHPVGKAGFIGDNVKELSPKLAFYVQKHIEK
jgi:hypothetical protein